MFLIEKLEFWIQLNNMSFLGHRAGSNVAKTVVEIYLDYCCPFSKKAYFTMVKDVVPYFNENHKDTLQFVFRHQVQPWHPQSSYTHEAGLAVERVDSSKFFDFSSVLFENQEMFNDANTLNKTRAEIYNSLADLAESVGVDKSKFLELLKLTDGGNSVTPDMKWFLKVSRQNSIHVSPTVLVNGLIDNSASSSWTLDNWKELLLK